MDTNVDVIVVGAGITGLVTTFLLKEKGVNVLLIEKNARAGGQLCTVSDDGFLFESGPNTGVVANKDVLNLFNQLGDECTLQTARKESKVRLIWKNGRFCPLPSGLADAVTTPLFSWHDKIRILFEPFRPKGNDPLESIASLTRRRLGKSFLNYAVDPFISGIYAGDPETLVTRFAMPKLYNLEHHYGSFIRGAIKRHPVLAEERKQGISKEIFSVKGGFKNLVSTLETRITPKHLRLGAGKIQIEPVVNGWKVVLPATGESYFTPRLISTVPAYALPELFPFMEERELHPITSLVYAPVVQVGVGMYNGSLIPQAFGGLVPSCEHEKILGVLFNSSCYDDRAPLGAASLSFFIGGMRHPEWVNLPEEEMVAIVTDALHRMLGYPLGTAPDKIHIFPHSRAIPQYQADTEQRLDTVCQLEKKYGGLVLAGSLRDGIGLADRIKQATQLASL